MTLSPPVNKPTSHDADAPRFPPSDDPDLTNPSFGCLLPQEKLPEIESANSKPASDASVQLSPNPRSVDPMGHRAGGIDRVERDHPRLFGTPENRLLRGNWILASVGRPTRSGKFCQSAGFPDSSVDLSCAHLGFSRFEPRSFRRGPVVRIPARRGQRSRTSRWVDCLSEGTAAGCVEFQHELFLKSGLPAFLTKLSRIRFASHC